MASLAGKSGDELYGYLLFIDESGDPTMQFSGREAPASPEIFLLCGCLFDTEGYDAVVGALADLKQRHMGRADLPLVSRQLRRYKGHFRFLEEPTRRDLFQIDIGQLIRETRFTAFAAGIDKYRYWERYGDAASSPYDLSLAFILERVTRYLAGASGMVHVIAEARGRREDNALRLEYSRLLQKGTRYVAGERLRNRFLPRLVFRQKRENVTGLQITDLVAYPLANRLCHPESRRIDFEIVYAKLHRSSRGTWGSGLKVFPARRAVDYGL